MPHWLSDSSRRGERPQREFVLPVLNICIVCLGGRTTRASPEVLAV